MTSGLREKQRWIVRNCSGCSSCAYDKENRVRQCHALPSVFLSRTCRKTRRKNPCWAVSAECWETSCWCTAPAGCSLPFAPHRCYRCSIHWCYRCKRFAAHMCYRCSTCAAQARQKMVDHPLDLHIWTAWWGRLGILCCRRSAQAQHRTV
jgi:hypothetical protein